MYNNRHRNINRKSKLPVAGRVIQDEVPYNGSTEIEGNGLRMKRIGFISKNRVLAQSLATLIKNNLDLPFEPHVLQNIEQAVMDVGILKIDVAVIEMIAEASGKTGNILLLCTELRQTAPDCQILLLVPQENVLNCEMAIKAVNTGVVDDYVFLDTSLDYLFAKLLAL